MCAYRLYAFTFFLMYLSGQEGEERRFTKTLQRQTTPQHNADSTTSCGIPFNLPRGLFFIKQLEHTHIPT